MFADGIFMRFSIQLINGATSLQAGGVAVNAFLLSERISIGLVRGTKGSGFSQHGDHTHCPRRRKRRASCGPSRIRESLSSLVRHPLGWREMSAG